MMFSERLPLHSLRTRLTLAFSLTLALFLLCASAVGIAYSRNAAEQAARRRLGAALGRLRQELARPDAQSELAELIEDSQDLSGEAVAVVVYDLDGSVRDKTPGTVPNRFSTAKTRAEWRTTALSFGTQTIVLGVPWRQTADALNRQAWVLLLVSLGVVPAASLGAWLLVGSTLSPIGKLTRQVEAASERSQNALRVRLNAPSQDVEMVALVTTLNALLARLEETAQARGRFYAAASHELRTPLQALSGHLELAGLRPRTTEEYAAVVAEASAQTQRLIALSRDLLALHQIETHTPPPSSWVDAEAVCQSTLRAATPLIEARNLHIEAVLPPFSLLVPPTHFEMLVRNLVENAIKYTDSGGRVRIEVWAEETETMLAIANSCHAFSLDNAERLFEPFYRPDPSRQAQTGGNGLGLAICRSLADVNGWRLSLHSDGGEVQATAVFPVLQKGLN